MVRESKAKCCLAYEIEAPEKLIVPIGNANI